MASIIFVLLLALYSLVSARFIPRRFYSASNLTATALAVLYGTFNNVSFAAMGLAPEYFMKGAVIGVLASIPIGFVLLAVVFHRRLQDFFTPKSSQHNTAGQRAFELGIRIPFGTALSEEVLFRGVLLGLLLNQGTLFALVVSAICFGFWHIIPTLDTMLENDALTTLVEGRKGVSGLPVLVAVVVTTLAGVAFGWLRILSGSLVAPWLVHFCVNSCAIAGGYLVLRQKTRK